MSDIFPPVYFFPRIMNEVFWQGKSENAE